MLIDKKKWNESATSDKLSFVRSIFYIASVNSASVSKDDLIVMCDFLLKHERERDTYERELKALNAEMQMKIDELIRRTEK